MHRMYSLFTRCVHLSSLHIQMKWINISWAQLGAADTNDIQEKMLCREGILLYSSQKKSLCCQKRNHSLELNSSVFLKIVSNIQSGSLSEIAQSQAGVRGARFTSQYILCASQIGPLGKILFHFFYINFFLTRNYSAGTIYGIVMHHMVIAWY